MRPIMSNHWLYIEGIVKGVAETKETREIRPEDSHQQGLAESRHDTEKVPQQRCGCFEHALHIATDGHTSDPEGWCESSTHGRLKHKG